MPPITVRIHPYSSCTVPKPSKIICTHLAIPHLKCASAGWWGLIIESRSYPPNLFRRQSIQHDFVVRPHAESFGRKSNNTLVLSTCLYDSCKKTQRHISLLSNAQLCLTSGDTSLEIVNNLAQLFQTLQLVELGDTSGWPIDEYIHLHLQLFGLVSFYIAFTGEALALCTGLGSFQFLVLSVLSTTLGFFMWWR